MYLISSSKLRKARKNYHNVLPYFTRMRDTISRVVPYLSDEPVHPFFHERQREDGDPRRAYLAVSYTHLDVYKRQVRTVRVPYRPSVFAPFCLKSAGLALI